MNQKNKQISNCCQAPIITAHGCDSDFGHNRGKCDCTMGTMWYECAECKLPCDVDQPESLAQDKSGQEENMIASRLLKSRQRCWCHCHTGCGPDCNMKCSHCHQESDSDTNVTHKEEGWNWEKEYDERFSVAIEVGTKTKVVNQDLKQFISQVRQDARKQTAEDIRQLLYTGATRDEVHRRIDEYLLKKGGE